MRKLMLSLVALGCVVSGHAEADRVAGQKVMRACQVCHGKDGIAQLAEAPNLAGQKQAYLEKSLKEYKSGARKHEQMAVIAGMLSETDIANVAEYYASITITATVPQ